jgi:hypothetical protein
MIAFPDMRTECVMQLLTDDMRKGISDFSFKRRKFNTLSYIFAVVYAEHA